MLTSNQLNKKYTIWKLAYLFTFGLILGSAIYFALFIYQNIFNALSNSYVIGLLKTGTNIDILDNKSYDKAREAIQAKNFTSTAPLNIRNIFINTENATTSTTTNTR